MVKVRCMFLCKSPTYPMFEIKSGFSSKEDNVRKFCIDP